jgi:hypothetical protein
MRPVQPLTIRGSVLGTLRLSRDQGTLLTGPYIFLATAEPGYTLRKPPREGRRGVIAAAAF